MKRKPQLSEEDRKTIEIAKHMNLDFEEVHLLMGGNGEEYAVMFIKAHLRTPAQKEWLDSQDLSIEDVLNGRFGDKPDHEAYIDNMFVEWNAKLGQKVFGF